MVDLALIINGRIHEGATRHSITGEETEVICDIQASLARDRGTEITASRCLSQTQLMLFVFRFRAVEF